MKFCKDCTFYLPRQEIDEFSYIVEGCDRRGVRHPVDSRPITRSAFGERSSILPTHCGSKGRHFNPKVVA